MSDLDHPVIRATMRRTFLAWREVNLLDYGSSRKRLAAELKNLAERLGVSVEEAEKIMLDKFGRAE